MKGEPQATIDPERMLAFANFVRDTPSVSASDARHLSAQFGLPVGLVSESLRVAEDSRPRPAAVSQGGSGRGLRIQVAFKRFLDLVYRRPVLTSVAIGGFAGIAAIITETMSGAPATIGSGVGLLLSIACLTILNGIRGEARYAIITSAVFVLLAVGINTIADLVSQRSFPDLFVVLGLVVVDLILTLVLSVCMIVASLVGGYIRVRREVAEESKLDRLQLLQRVFDLQEKLTASTTGEPANAQRRNQLLALRRRWPFVALAAGVGIGLLSVLQAMTVGLPQGGLPPSAASLAVSILTLGLTFACLPVVGFISGSFFRGLVGGVLFVASQTAAQLLPVSGLGWSTIAQTYSVSPMYSILNLIAVALVGLSGLGGTVEERRQHKARLAAQDQSTILSEIIRVQQLLQTGAADVCVMVVDCVQSTRMKAGADPLKVEASFRAFHEFVAGTIRKHSGSVYSTAGDGVVAQFSGAPDAFAAARSIQTCIPEFNTRANRLADPFRVRIGLHCGSIHGDLHQVGFSAVIDIAAHIEKEAPAGGIVVTDPFRVRLPGERFAQLAHEVDGHAIHIAMNPTA